MPQLNTRSSANNENSAKSGRFCTLVHFQQIKVNLDLNEALMWSRGTKKTSKHIPAQGPKSRLGSLTSAVIINIELSAE